MTPFAVALVLVSVATHAWWNLQVKRAGGGATFLGLSKLLEAALFAPVFLVLARDDLALLRADWPLVLVAATLTLLNYAALGRAYATGELGVVYAVARGAALLVLPLFGFLLLGERVSAAGWLGIAAIVLGLLLVQLPALTAAGARSLGAGLARPATRWALLAALATAGYTAWDRRAVQSLPPFTYFYAYTAVVAAAYGAWLLRARGAGALAAEWRRHRGAIAQVAVLNTVTYLLVLFALRTSTSSYVLGLRQLGIAVGAVLGWWLLGERFGAPKRVGVAVLVLGCAVVAVA
jgi:drug/metabolite transporter (DMT)-like permease